MIVSYILLSSSAVIIFVMIRNELRFRRVMKEHNQKLSDLKRLSRRIERAKQQEEVINQMFIEGDTDLANDLAQYSKEEIDSIEREMKRLGIL